MEQNMNKKQIVAAKSLERALKKCGLVGLVGGVFDGSFCVWPSDCISPHRVEESGENDFFGAVEKESCGIVLHHGDMYLDSGAGN